MQVSIIHARFLQVGVSGIRALMALCACLTMLLNSIDSHADTAPQPALELQRQQQREREMRKELEPREDVRLPREGISVDTQDIPEGEKPCFVINTIRLAGESAERFQFALQDATHGDDPALGRCLGVLGINAVIARVQHAIIAKGFVTTRVLAGSQDLSAGELVLTLIPGRIRKIRFSADASARRHLWNALPASPGDLLNLRDIEQGLENLKRPPTADAEIQIEPATDAGAKPGESDLVIHYRQGFPFRLTLSADDGGSETTGKTQGGMTLSGDNLLALNDLFYYSVNHNLDHRNNGGRGTRGYTAHYSLPFGYWLLALTTSKNHYKQSVAGFSQDYVYEGESSNAALELSRLLYRDNRRKTTATLQAYLETSRNYIDDTEIDVQRRRMAGWQASSAHREFFGAATLDVKISYQRGTGMLNAMPAPEERFDEGTSRPKIAHTEASLDLPFTLAGLSLRYQGGWRAQWNRTPLVPQDRFSIGGRYTVRGFDGETILSAERGWLVRNDLGLALGESGQQIYLGIDYGEVGGQTAGLLLGRRLAGAVAGLRGGYKALYWDLFAGGALKVPDGFPTGGVSGFNLSFTY